MSLLRRHAQPPGALTSQRKGGGRRHCSRGAAGLSAAGREGGRLRCRQLHGSAGRWRRWHLIGGRDAHGIGAFAFARLVAAAEMHVQVAPLQAVLTVPQRVLEALKGPPLQSQSHRVTESGERMPCFPPLPPLTESEIGAAKLPAGAGTGAWPASVPSHVPSGTGG